MRFWKFLQNPRLVSHSSGTILALRAPVRIVFTFYRNILFPSLVVSLVSCYTLVAVGGTFVIPTLFIIKVTTSILLGLYIHIFRSEQLYFFFNLGYSRVRLYAGALILDLVLWILLITVTSFFL